MAIPLIINGVTFNYPQQGDVNWGPTLTNWSSAVTNALQVTSNNFTLLTNHDIVFKDSEGTPKSLTLGIPSPLTATWVLTLPVNAGTVGQVLSTDGAGITSWINAAGGGTINSGTTGQLAYYPGNGTTLSGETMSGDATIAAGGALTIANDAITNVKVAAAAAIAVTKLAALTASRVVTSDGSGFLTTTASPTLTELGYVGGVTSAIQTQLNTLTSNQANYLPLAGGTMSGQINMGSNKIISMTQGSSTGEAISFPITGSTANSGGSAGQISQGTLSTPDFRTNAVTINNSTDQDMGSLATNTLITSFSITTIGKPVLIVGSASITGSSGTVLAKARCGHPITLAMDGTGLTSSVSRLAMNNTANSFDLTSEVPIMFLHTPSAGSHTYALYYQTGEAISPGVFDFHLEAIELRA